MRCRRYPSIIATLYARTGRVSSNAASQRAGIPAVKTMAPATAARASALPMSGSFTIRAAKTSTSAPTLAKAGIGDSRASSFAATTAAAKRMTTSFANSDGCTPTPATPSQRWALLMGRAKKTATRPATVMATRPCSSRGCRHTR